MASTIVTKNSSTASAVPVAGDLTKGELAVNVTDKRLFTKDNSGSVVELGINPSSLTLTGGTANGVAYLNGSKVVTTGSALTFSGSVLTVNNANGGFSLTDPTASVGVNFTWYNGGAVYSYGQLGLRDVTNSQTAYTYFSGSSGYHNWFQNGTEGMRLTSTGLGIGTSSPNVNLQVGGGTGSQILAIDGGTSAAQGGALAIRQSGTYKAGIGTAALIDGSGTNADLRIQSYSDNVDIRTVAAKYITFSTTNTERMRLDASGNLGLGVTPSAWTLGKAIEVGYKGAALWGVGSNDVYLTSNMNYDGGFKYATTNVAAYYNLSGNIHKWFTAPSGTAGNAITFTQAMTLDASGNLGVGITSPSTYAALAVKDNGGNGTIAAISASNVLYIKNSGTVASITYNDAYPLTFGTNNTERARIDSSGNLLVGTTNATPFFGTSEGSVINGSYIGSSRSGGPAIYVNRYTSTGTSVDFRYDGSTVGTISVTASATAYNTSSDYRLKDNQQPLTGSGAFIDALQPKTWEWKTDGSKGVGFIAHEVQAISPGSVVGEKDAVNEDGKPKYQAMEYGSAEFIANIIAELQSLRKRLAAAGIA